MFPVPGAPAERCAGEGGRAPRGIFIFPHQTRCPVARAMAGEAAEDARPLPPLRKTSSGVGRAGRATLRTCGGAAAPTGRSAPGRRRE